MPRSEKSRAARQAEKMLRDAIAAETVALQAELAAEKRESDRLRGVLAQIASTATKAAGEQTAPAPSKAVLPPELQRQLEEPPLPPQPPDFVPSDQDDMGEGRFV